MRVGRHHRLPITVETIEGRAVPAVRIMLPTGPLPTPVMMDTPDWERIVATFDGDFPGITPNDNGKNGKPYLRLALPRRPGQPKGEMVMLSHLVLGLDEMDGKQVKYRDCNPLNLCRDNLQTPRRGATAPEAEGSA